MYSLLPEREAWQSAVHLKSVCQGVIPDVANRSIWARSLASEFQYPPFFFDSSLFVALRHICTVFLMCDSLSVKPIRGRLFCPKLYISGLSLSHYLVILSLSAFRRRNAIHFLFFSELVLKNLYVLLHALKKRAKYK
jgi:hypothetical protein